MCPRLVQRHWTSWHAVAFWMEVSADAQLSVPGTIAEDSRSISPALWCDRSRHAGFVVVFKLSGANRLLSG